MPTATAGIHHEDRYAAGQYYQILVTVPGRPTEGRTAVHAGGIGATFDVASGISSTEDESANGADSILRVARDVAATVQASIQPDRRQ